MSTSLAVPPKNATSFVIFPHSPSLFADFDNLSRQIAQRAFSLFRDRGDNGRDLDDWFRAEAEFLKPVPLELSEDDANYTIRAEVPGFTQKEISVLAESNSIIIEGKKEERKEEKSGKEIKYSEVSASQLRRRIDLPTSINPEKVSANLVNGVLELTIPKAAPPKAIEVKTV